MTSGSGPDDRSSAPGKARRIAGKRADLSGRAAEERVVTEYQQRGYILIASRWRGQGGEIDLIFCKDERVIFAEVKKARTIDAAIHSLRPAQMRRIHDAASEFLDTMPKGQLTEVRFDLAAMDETGKIQLIVDAFSHF